MAKKLVQAGAHQASRSQEAFRKRNVYHNVGPQACEELVRNRRSVVYLGLDPTVFCVGSMNCVLQAAGILV